MPVTASTLRASGPTLSLPEANRVLGIADSTGYAAVRNGGYPARTIPVGKRIRVVTEDLIRVLQLDEHAAA